jgi:hypothetical protein
LQEFEFNLGFGIKTTSPKEAGELLMKREYPQILRSATTPHEAIFIPEVYLYSSTTEKVIFLYFFCYCLIIYCYSQTCSSNPLRSVLRWLLFRGCSSKISINFGLMGFMPVIVDRWLLFRGSC